MEPRLNVTKVLPFLYGRGVEIMRKDQDQDQDT